MMKDRTRRALMVAAVAVLIFFLWHMSNNKSKYTLVEREMAPIDAGEVVGPSAGAAKPEGGCQMQAGTGLASALLPREIASEEDFTYAPEELLKNQNFLDPRQQIGVPETVGGSIRNGNQQLRAELPNPRSQFVWQNSTIVPDTMRRPLC